MRKITVFALILILLLTASGCDTATEHSTHPEESIPTQTEQKEPYERINNPYGNLHNNARNVWDMVIYDGYLYIGAGDFDKNISPAVAYRYSLDEQEWENCGVIPDEQIDRLSIIGGELIIPGCDPTGDWSMGNFYKLENGKFTTYRTIPNGVHCFDIAEHNGKMFAALGYSEANPNFPVAVSSDGGKSFTQAEVTSKNSFNRRVYKLFPHGDSLYALNGADIYKYDGNAFVYETNWKSKLVSGYPFYSQISESVYFNGRTYFTTGYLFHFSDPKELQYTVFENAIVTDLAICGDFLYVLCAKPLDNGNYLICLCETSDGSNYETVKTLEYPLPALSFAKNGNDLYLGIGDQSIDNGIQKGHILKTEITQ